MSRETSRRSPAFSQALWALLASDRLAQLGLVLSSFAAAFLLLPEISIELKGRFYFWLAPVSIILILSALLWRRGEITDTGERRFWDYLLASFGWMAVAVVLNRVPLPAAFVKPAGFASDLALAVFYFFLVVAGEHEPDRPHRPVPKRFETLLLWPSAGIFVLGFLVYFTLIQPSPSATIRFSAPLKTVYLFLALDTYLLLRFGLLSRLSASPRWRLIYWVWALSFGGLLIDDCLRLLTSAYPDTETLSIVRYVFWLVPPFLAVVATRLRHLPSARQPAPRSAAPYHDAQLPAAGSRTLIFALSFPCVHFLFHWLGLLDPVQKPLYAAVVFVWMSLLGLVALAQTWWLDRRAAELWSERKRFETQLESSEDDLRLILERRRAERSLKVAEDRFETIFRICPDAVCITTEKTGLIVDVNPGFERITGFSRAEMLGSTLTQLGIREPPDGREELIRQLDRRGAAMEFEVNFRNRAGRLRIARLLLDRITIGGEPCLITLARDVTERRRLEIERAKQAALLDNAMVAIFALDGADRISFWNRSAEQLFGQSAEVMLGLPVAALGAASRSDSPLTIELWSTPILDDRGRIDGRLVIAREAPPANLAHAAPPA